MTSLNRVKKIRMMMKTAIVQTFDFFHSLSLRRSGVYLLLSALALILLSSCAEASPTITPSRLPEPTTVSMEVYQPLDAAECRVLADRLKARFGQPADEQTAPFLISGELRGQGCSFSWQGRETAFRRSDDPAQAARTLLLEDGWFDEYNLPEEKDGTVILWTRRESDVCRIESTLDRETNPDQPIYSLAVNCAANPQRWAQDYLPLPLEECRSIRQEVIGILGLDFDEVEYAHIEDPIGQRAGTSCRIQRISSSLAVQDQEEGYNRLKRAFEIHDWVEDPSYLTAWPSGMLGAVRKNGSLGIIRIEWTPQEGDCPGEGIAIDCRNAGEQQVYTILLDLVQLPFQVKE